MAKILLCLISFILLNSLAKSIQPYFPSQVVFSPDNGQTIYAIDEINQRAYRNLSYGSLGEETAFAMKNFPYASPDSPQSKYYVQLVTDYLSNSCQYETYWKYGSNTSDAFPSHWFNGTSFEIKNYMNYTYKMIHSTNSSADEDYWYSDRACQLYSQEVVPCEEIYFKKNTVIPLRSVLVRVIRRDIIQVTINYQIISVGKPDDKYFNSIPTNWSMTCLDVNLGLLYEPQTSKIDLNQSTKVQIWLPTPPHRINGSDTVRIQWNPSECNDCFIISPKELSFNIANFQEKQNLTITRIKNGPKTTLIPNFNGGGFDLVPVETYPIYIE